MPPTASRRPGVPASRRPGGARGSAGSGGVALRRGARARPPAADRRGPPPPADVAAADGRGPRTRRGRRARARGARARPRPRRRSRRRKEGGEGAEQIHGRNRAPVDSLPRVAGTSRCRRDPASPVAYCRAWPSTPSPSCCRRTDGGLRVRPRGRGVRRRPHGARGPSGRLPGLRAAAAGRSCRAADDHDRPARSGRPRGRRPRRRRRDRAAGTSRALPRRHPVGARGRGGHRLACAPASSRSRPAGCSTDGEVTAHWVHCRRAGRGRTPPCGSTPTCSSSTTATSSPAPARRPGIDACLHLVRKHRGAAVASTIARRMVVPPQRDGGQRQYVDLPVAGVLLGQPRAGHALDA